MQFTAGSLKVARHRIDDVTLPSNQRSIMENEGTAIIVSIFVNKVFWGQFLIYTDGVVSNEDYIAKYMDDKLLEHKSSTADSTLEKLRRTKSKSSVKRPSGMTQKYAARICMNGYLLSSFSNVLHRSKIYRQNVIKRFSGTNNKYVKTSMENTCLGLPVYVKLVAPKYEAIDLNWSNRIVRMLVERRELDNAMSWFSTFGGAFSALGEEFSHCAEVAGKISLRQLSIALHLGDPLTVARCKLYWALSKIQQGHLKEARKIIEMQYQLAKEYKALDERLVRMCFGIWAKLKYEYHLERERKKKIAK